MTLDKAIERYTSNAEHERTHGNLQGCLDFRQFAEWLTELKKLREQTRWIPVSERLPEKEGLYLVSVKNDHERRYSKTCQYMGRNHWFARQDVEAWMPLPKPYEPQESNDKCKNCEYYRNPDYTRCHECKAERSGEG